MKPLAALAAFVLLMTASIAAHAMGRIADVRIQDRETGLDLPVYWHDGRAYIVGRPGARYEVVVTNRIGDDLLAVVAVDGVNVLSGRTASPDQGGYVVGAWQRVGIRGWRRSLDDVAAFYFTSLGDSYAGRTGRPDNVGVIGVALYRRARNPWRMPLTIAPEAKQAPQASDGAPEPGANAQRSEHAQAKRAYGAASAPLGTGFGEREDAPARYVEFERASREPAQIVTLYYDSYPNLVAQGIIPSRREPRDPQPFPGGFVPDPA